MIKKLLSKLKGGKSKPKKKAAKRKRTVAKKKPAKKKTAAKKRKPVKRRASSTKKTRKAAPKKKATRTKKKAPAKKRRAAPAPKKPAGPDPSDEVGIIIAFFRIPVVAVIKMTRGSLKPGDKIWVHGHTTNFKMKVASMQVDHQPVSGVGAGKEAGVKISSRARRGDRVYRIA